MHQYRQQGDQTDDHCEGVVIEETGLRATQQICSQVDQSGRTIDDDTVDHMGIDGT